MPLSYGAGSVTPFDDDKTGNGFQCTELANRYLFSATGTAILDKGLVGGNFVKMAAQATGRPVGTPGPGSSPWAGDIISMWSEASGQNGPETHVAIVTAVTTTKAGWTITTLNQDDVSDRSAPPKPGDPFNGLNTITVTGQGATWSFNGGHFTQFEWLELVQAPTSSAPAIATSVSGHGGGYCVTLKSHQVECWGSNQFGLLGDGGTEPNSYVPVYVKGLTGVTNLAGNADTPSENNCALLAIGRVECWGDNGAGELGNGTEEDSNVPVTVRGITGAKAAFAMNSLSCAILRTGRVYCWGGGGTSGGLGDGNDESSDVPVSVHGITDATSLLGGGDAGSTCALLTTGGVDCWGYNEEGSFTDELGNGGNEAYSYVPVSVSGITNASGVFGSGYPYCAVLSTGRVDCWGSDIFVGSDGASVASNVPVPISGVADAKSIVMANGSECALLTTGGVDCWGASTTAVRVRDLTNAVGIASTSGTFCALRATGVVSCWGYGSNGQLGNGNGSVSYFSVPVAARGLSNAVRIDGGDNSFCALLKTGGVDCWGLNFAQQPGANGVQYSTVPVPVAGLGS
jgi:alpha-tubulin suppressor-like RCC1 family protein